MAKFRILLVGTTWGGCTDDDRIDFIFETLEETFEKAKFFLSQGYTIEIQNVIEEQVCGG